MEANLMVDEIYYLILRVNSMITIVIINIYIYIKLIIRSFKLHFHKLENYIMSFSAFELKIGICLIRVESENLNLQSF